MLHTDGPWGYMKTDDWIALNEKGDQPSSVCHIGDYTIVTKTPSYEFHGTDENDAKLIATAPDLLKELKELVDLFDGYQGLQMKRAKALIASVNG